MSDQPASVMLARTPLSATETHHYSHGLYSVWPKVYFQDPLGQIRTVNGNEGGASVVAVPKANLNNQFAAISWGGPESVVRPEVRTIYLYQASRTHKTDNGSRSVFTTPTGLVRSMRYRFFVPPWVDTEVYSDSHFFWSDSIVGAMKRAGIPVN